MNRNEAGYTLTEMLVVIAIIGLLAAVLTPMLGGQLARARVKAAKLELETVSVSLESFRSDVGRYPTASEGLGALVQMSPPIDGWLGPYVRSKANLNDPWGHPLEYVASGGDQPPKVGSLGADGKPGGTGANSDISAGGEPQ